MEKRIFLDNDGKKKLCKIFGVSKMTVWRALTFDQNSELSRKIRYVALAQLGGTASKNIEACVDVETSHEEVENTMTQTFGPRVKLVFYKDTDQVIIFVDGKVDRREECKTIDEFMRLQGEVTMKAMSL